MFLGSTQETSKKNIRMLNQDQEMYTTVHKSTRHTQEKANIQNYFKKTNQTSKGQSTSAQVETHNSKCKCTITN